MRAQPSASEAGHGSPVVLLSPGCAWVFAWLPAFRAVAESHHVFAVDMPGQGFTQIRQRNFEFDLNGMTAAVGSFLDAMHLSTVTLAGNSWSGGWAIAFTERHPSRIDRLILLAPSGLARPDPLSWELFKLPVVGRALANLTTTRGLTASDLRGLVVHKNLVTPTFIDAMWAPNTLPDNLRADYELEAGLDWRVTQRGLRSISQPTLLVWGRQDSVLPVSQAPQFTADIPHIHTSILDHCGHALTLDCAPQVTALMQGFPSAG